MLRSHCGVLPEQEYDLFDDKYHYCTMVLIKKITQTAVIIIVFQRIFIKLDVSYASQHTFSKVTVTIFENYIYIS